MLINAVHLTMMYLSSHMYMYVYLHFTTCRDHNIDLHVSLAVIKLSVELHALPICFRLNVSGAYGKTGDNT